MKYFIAAVVGLAAYSGPVDPELHDWFESLTLPGGIPGSCCKLADCHMVQDREGADGFEAFINEKWMRIPPSVVLQRHDNPTGRAVACWTSYRDPNRDIGEEIENILCFVPSTGV